ncbi:MAG: hypothetical protein IKY44_02320 [Clostridia bacterium]|nr:hypothetical protein [Clostridia bacterium]
MSDQFETFEIEEENDTDGSSPTKKRIIILVVAVLLALIAAFLFINRRHLAPMKFSEWVSDSFIRIGSGEGYPYSVNANAVNDIAAFNKDSAILTDASLIILNSSSKEITNRQLTYSNPVMKTSIDRILVYDVGGNSFSVHTRSSQVFEGSTKNAISVCAIGDYGNFAVATRDDVYSGSVTFYSYKFREEFTWNSGNSYIIALALSPDGEYGAAVTLNARNGNAYSTVYLFNFETGATLTHEPENIVISNVAFNDDGTLSMISDNGAIISDFGDGSFIIRDDSVKYEAIGTMSYACCDNGNYIATISKAYENNDIYTLNYINHKYETSFSATIEEKVYDVYTSEKYCAVLTDKSIHVYDYEGALISSVSVDSLGADSNVQKVLLCKSELYALTTNQIISVEY